MKIQVERKEVRLECIDVKFPIYSYIEEGDNVIYTKLTKTKFEQITVGLLEVIVTRFKANHKTVAEVWINNKSDWKEFQEGVRQLKDYINNL